ncbi:hypothetical protein [Streptosporangium lutulentum]|uniref:Uncharacterized protein n=1 Tax=Streptosporangium lutulentum TaxID=1461250 RepID=A0ABT9QAL2_9ACTN|nr:hypothetical protein [Streptosporangium lutulentum]MDP9843333.1 hypothetical protein [Streptosporangium lutulentum]
MARITDLFDEDKLRCLAMTAAEVVDQLDHGDLLSFLSERQIEVAQEAYRELIELPD